MKNLKFLVIAFLCTMSTPASAQAIDGLLQRILPEDANRIEYSITDFSTDAPHFRITCDGNSAHIYGSDNVAIATGINWLLQHHAGVNISWNNPTGKLPAELPVIAGEEHSCSVDYRYYLNFCTHSYSMAFWDWDRWQQEIDWMALHGINMPLVITGMESIWKRVLTEDYGYSSLDQVNEFVAGAAYYGWFFMNNMTAWGGPQPESWYAQRETLAKKIFTRMKEYGMQPVVPGYVGMVPKNFLKYANAAKVAEWKASDIVNGGTWCSFERPYFVNNTTRLKEFGDHYYAKISEVFGDCLNTHLYAIDPFHEGGVPSGVTNAKASVGAMYESLLRHDDKAIWVAQHWQDNPTTILTHTVPKGKLIILDLHGDSSGDTSCSGHHTDVSGRNHDWIWGQVSNFGGNVGLFGRVGRLISCFYTARDNASKNALVGIGALPEGIENNLMLYDLLYALPWTNDDYTQQTWTKDYVKMRYGATGQTAKTLESVWTRLLSGIYNCPDNRQQGTTESVFLMRPSTKAGTVSSWANSSWYWDMEELRTAVFEMLSVAEELCDNENYRYDLVDMMRQALADLGKLTLDSISSASSAQRKPIADRFLQLILDQDRLLGTQKEFRLGRWTEMARNLGQNEAEKELYEKNARMLLTTWGDQAQCETGGLHDYANREWNGLLSSYYYPRWNAFFQKNYATQNWFYNYEKTFVEASKGMNANYLPDGAPYEYGSFTSEPVGDAVTIARELYNKYFGDFQPKVWTLYFPDTSKTYLLKNTAKWYAEADKEGLNLTPPNSDYNGYRLKRSAIKANDHAFWWEFESSTTIEGAVKVKNVKLSETGNTAHGKYLCSTPSTSAYPAFTFNNEGSDYYVYGCGDQFFLKDATGEIFMSPDVKWEEACVLVGKSRLETSLLHLIDVETGELTGIENPSSFPNPSPLTMQAIYNIQGKRISRPVKGQIYIASGHKFLKK